MIWLIISSKTSRIYSSLLSIRSLTRRLVFFGSVLNLRLVRTVEEEEERLFCFPFFILFLLLGFESLDRDFLLVSGPGKYVPVAGSKYNSSVAHTIPSDRISRISMIPSLSLGALLRSSLCLPANTSMLLGEIDNVSPFPTIPTNGPLLSRGILMNFAQMTTPHIINLLFVCLVHPHSPHDRTVATPRRYQDCR